MRSSTTSSKLPGLEISVNSLIAVRKTAHDISIGCVQLTLKPSMPVSFHHFSKKSATISGVCQMLGLASLLNTMNLWEVLTPTGLGLDPPSPNISATTLGVKTFSLAITLMLSITPCIVFS